jgi:hypothetical protein
LDDARHQALRLGDRLRQRRHECPFELNATDALPEHEDAPVLTLAADLDLDPGYLAERLVALAALEPDERTAIGLQPPASPTQRSARTTAGPTPR